MVTSPLYQPAALSGVVGAPTSVGFVRSMLTLSTVVVLVLPALSCAFPTTDWAAPSLASVTGSVHPAIPDSASEQTKLAVTGPLFQPNPFVAGARLPTIVGGTPSIRSVIV